MKAVALISQKGGTGKSTLATHLAVCAAMSSILMAPNPAQDRTELGGLPSGAVITLFDLLGNQVALPIRANNRATLPTSHLADGLYLVKVQSQGHSRSLRLVVRR